VIVAEDLVSVRYMVNDVEQTVDFFTRHLGFALRSSAAPAFAGVFRARLRPLPAGPRSSAGRAMPDGRTLGPGGQQTLLEDPSGNPIEIFHLAGD
jgi:hypothetical protein